MMNAKENRRAPILQPTPVDEATRVAHRFEIPGRLVQLHPLKVGHIHDSYVSAWRDGEAVRRYLHQRLNEYVFPDLKGLMNNLQLVTRHLRRAARREGEEGLVTQRLVKSRQGELLVRDSAGEFWLTFHYIEGTETLEQCDSAERAFEAGRMFGRFVALLRELDPGLLVDTIPRFMDTPHRYRQLWSALAEDAAGRASAARHEIEFARSREAACGRLVEALGGELPRRVVHYDPKLNNLLFDARTGRGVCVVDLDTCMSGTPLYDLGDLIRSAAVPCREDEPDLSQVYVERDYLRAILEGYLGATEQLLTPGEKRLLPEAPPIMAMTLGIRFLADHLNGDRYFKVDFEGHNLQRARTQFAIAQQLFDWKW